jgi:hypothetical protein
LQSLHWGISLVKSVKQENIRDGHLYFPSSDR